MQIISYSICQMTNIGFSSFGPIAFFSFLSFPFLFFWQVRTTKWSIRVFRATGRLVNIALFGAQTIYQLPPSTTTDQICRHTKLSTVRLNKGIAKKRFRVPTSFVRLQLLVTGFDQLENWEGACRSFVHRQNCWVVYAKTSTYSITDESLSDDGAAGGQNGPLCIWNACTYCCGVNLFSKALVGFIIFFWFVCVIAHALVLGSQATSKWRPLSVGVLKEGCSPAERSRGDWEYYWIDRFGRM